MNQILMTEVQKKGRKKKDRNTTTSIEIAKIVRFFAVFIIIFALFNSSLYCYIILNLKNL